MTFLPLGASAATERPAGRFLSEAECQALFKRVVGFISGRGTTGVSVQSSWAGGLRWARNRVLNSSDRRSNVLTVSREIQGALGTSTTNALDDRRLFWAVRRAERGLGFKREVPDALTPEPAFFEPWPRPKIWFDTTYKQEAAERAALMRELVKPAEQAGMLAAGNIQVMATGVSSMDGERVWYYPYTWGYYVVTVRSPDGSGSGWAAADHNDWSKIDTAKLSEIALEKCLRSRNPVRLEPGRYTAILEPQAVGDFIMGLFSPGALDRDSNEAKRLPGDPVLLRTDPRYKKDPKGPFNEGYGHSKLGQQVIDPRLTVRTDNMDPDLGFVPFEGWQVYHPATWIQDGVLTELAYNREYAVQKLGKNTGGLPQYGQGVPDMGAFRMIVKGETTSVEEMITTTKRGLLVTRFVNVRNVGGEVNPARIQTGYTRDGLWLVENGKLSKPVKNFRFTESPVFALNNIEQIGAPQRIFNYRGWDANPVAPCPVIVPALKVRDFSFTSLSDAV